jgi:RNA polymerase sigma-70 factor, ECF subfamily
MMFKEATGRLMQDETFPSPGRSPEAFEAFLVEHYDRIFAYAWRILGNREDAEDLAHDICLSLPRKLAGFRGDSKASTWLYRIVCNAAIDVMRKRETLSRSKPVWGEALEQMAVTGHERTADLDWLRSAMMKLPDELRVTAALLVDEDMSQAEAAEILNVAPGTVAWRMSEIKRHLKEVAKEDGHVS